MDILWQFNRTIFDYILLFSGINNILDI